MNETVGDGIVGRLDCLDGHVQLYKSIVKTVNSQWWSMDLHLLFGMARNPITANALR